MNDQAIAYYARKFFPHMLPHYGALCVKLKIEAHNRRRDREARTTGGETEKKQTDSQTVKDATQ